jgi:hypothetical protein
VKRLHYPVPEIKHHPISLGHCGKEITMRLSSYFVAMSASAAGYSDQRLIFLIELYNEGMLLTRATTSAAHMRDGVVSSFVLQLSEQKWHQVVSKLYDGNVRECTGRGSEKLSLEYIFILRIVCYNLSSKPLYRHIHRCIRRIYSPVSIPL